MKQKYEICLVLASDKYVDLSEAQNVFDQRRGFRLYKWVSEYKTTLTHPAVSTNESGIKVRTWEEEKISIGVWQYWMFFSGHSWKIIGEELARFGKIDQKEIMMKGHMFFDTEEDFMKWLPEDQQKKMFMDLI